ncbi:MAG: hypothetical protein JG766_1893 [Desulfacinum sp.]|jgi:hypothetical protein|nr:hypothetical protein [Desulfacinum sp.]
MARSRPPRRHSGIRAGKPVGMETGERPAGRAITHFFPGWHIDCLCIGGKRNQLFPPREGRTVQPHRLAFSFLCGNQGKDSSAPVRVHARFRFPWVPRGCPKAAMMTAFPVAPPCRAAEAPPGCRWGRRALAATSWVYHGPFRGAEAPRLRGGPKSLGFVSRRAVVGQARRSLSKNGEFALFTVPSSSPRKRGSRIFGKLWTPACAGVTV